MTFLFTDVEGSTRQGAADSEALSVSLRQHDRILRDAIESNGGHVFATSGDSFAGVFDRASAACLATSREALELDGEHAWRVPSLALGPGSAATQFFVERATTATAAFDPAGASAEVIGEICERLDGIPLAIELAAARVRSMSVTEIRDRLDDRFRLLSGGRRRARQRQQTLEATVQWSYELLTPDERSMLPCLSVFQGGFAFAHGAGLARRRHAALRRRARRLGRPHPTTPPRRGAPALGPTSLTVACVPVGRRGGSVVQPSTRRHEARDQGKRWRAILVSNQWLLPCEGTRQGRENPGIPGAPQVSSRFGPTASDRR